MRHRPTSLCRLSQKYGVPLDTIADLLDPSRHLKVTMLGISFHRGLGVLDQ